MIETLLEMTRTFIDTDFESAPILQTAFRLVDGMAANGVPVEDGLEIVAKMELNVNEDFILSDESDEIIDNYVKLFAKVVDAVEKRYPGQGLNFLKNSAPRMSLTYME